MPNKGSICVVCCFVSMLRNPLMNLSVDLIITMEHEGFINDHSPEACIRSYEECNNR